MNFIALDPKSQFSLGLDLAQNFIIFHPSIEGYAFLVIDEHWVDLENAISVCGIHLGFFGVIFGPEAQ